MAKVIKIESCWECDYQNYGFCDHPDVESSTIMDLDTIPDWCPLPDAQEDEHE